MVEAADSTTPTWKFTQYAAFLMPFRCYRHVGSHSVWLSSSECYQSFSRQDYEDQLRGGIETLLKLAGDMAEQQDLLTSYHYHCSSHIELRAC